MLDHVNTFPNPLWGTAKGHSHDGVWSLSCFSWMGILFWARIISGLWSWYLTQLYLGDYCLLVFQLLNEEKLENLYSLNPSKTMQTYYEEKKLLALWGLSRSWMKRRHRHFFLTRAVREVGSSHASYRLILFSSPDSMGSNLNPWSRYS